MSVCISFGIIQMLNLRVSHVFISEIAKLLLLFGADVNDAGGDHCGNVTPLHDASQNGHIETVKLLISRGANPLAKDAKVCRL